MKHLILAAAVVILGFATCPAHATQYSKLSIITAAKALGKWEAVKSWIDAAGYSDEWAACQYLSDNYPQFPAITNAVVAAGLMTAEEVRNMMSASVDVAVPDTMIMRVVSNDCLTVKGCEKWHGPIVGTPVTDTNALTKTFTYTDGFVFVERFKSARAMGLEQRLSAAERKAKAEEEMARRKAAREKARQKRIDALTTNMTAEVSALMARKRWPEPLARLYLENELNTLIGTNVVDAVVMPQ